MPWNPKDADSYTQRADDPKLKKQWAKVADKVLQATGDEGKAVKEANGVVEKQQAKKSVCEDLMDLAKAIDFNDLAKNTTYGPRKSPHFAAAGFQHFRFKKPGFHKPQFRHPKNVGRLSSTGKRNYKSVDATNKDLEDESKGIGNTVAPYTPLTVRAHRRDVTYRQNANRVAPYQRRKFKDSSQIKNVVNTQDI